LPRRGSVQDPRNSREEHPPDEPLVAYLKENAPKLPRPAQEILEHPSIAAASTATRLPELRHALGLGYALDRPRSLRLANLTGNHGLHTKVAEHTRGSLLKVFAHRSPRAVSPSGCGPFIPASLSHKAS
ncbi:MAG TPA: hypothetical protein VK593_07830, partial [Edaphobacter sp.]|nr:hypothetical protein [Edaphobacter sp.]